MKKAIEQIQQHYQVLCAEIGERHIGSDGEKKAVEYLLKEFKEIGCETLTEEYDEPGWKYGEHSLRNADTGAALPCFPCYYSNAANISGKLVIIEERDLCSLEQMDIKNKICFLNAASDMGQNVGGRNEVAQRLDKAGAGALIVLSNYSNIYNTKIVRNANLKQLCVVSVSGDAALEILANRDCEFSLKVDAEKFQTKSCNVIGRIKGNSSRKILFGAHYDTAPGIQGACDNASGIAAMLEAARLLKSKNLDLTIDFVAFGAEEYGDKTGSSVYVKEHKNELQNIEYMCNLDDLGCPIGTSTACAYGSEKFLSLTKDTLGKHNIKYKEAIPNSSDDKYFYEANIPVVSFGCEVREYIQIHSPNDNLSKVCAKTTAKAAYASAELAELYENIN